MIWASAAQLGVNEMAVFNIVLQTRSCIQSFDDPTDFISGYSGVITCTDDETGAETKVGRVSALRVHAGLACDAGESLFDVCDAHSGELQYLHTLLYEPDGHSFKEAVMREFDATNADLLLIDYIILDPRWRKLKLGLLAARKLVDLIGSGVGLAVSEIAPLRAGAHKQLRIPKDWLPLHANKDEQKAATVRLRRYFRRMGFRRLGKTPYYALSLAQIVPSAAELLGPEQDGD
jgi:hypothetical protein